MINHLEFEIMMTYSSKPLHALVADAVILKDCLEMAEAVAVANGAKSLSEKPFVMAFLNCISPLIYNDDTIEKLLLSVDMGIPFICGPAPLAGGTSPVTMAGTIVQNNAERLAGLVIAQVRKKGAPVVMSGTGAVLDMMSGESVYSPQRVLMAAGALELGHYYGVPVQSGSVQGNSGQCAKGILDAEMGWQQMLSGMNVALLRGNAGASVGAGQSLETCVLADEIVGILKATVMQGIKVDDDSLAVDAICEIGPGGGTFLGHPHTYMHFGEQWRPGLIPWQRHREWVETGSKTTMDHIKERVDHILSTHQPKPLPEAVKPKIAEIIDRARARVPAPSTAD